MLLDRDEFVITFDPAGATEAQLIAKVKKSGYTAQVVTEKNKADQLKAKMASLPDGYALLDDALARAASENKPLVLDFYAEWCVPCRRMEKTTLIDPRVTALLAKVVFVRIDTDQQPEIAQKLGVEGLPDIRFVATDGKILRQFRGYQEAEPFAAALERLVRETTVR